MPLSRSRDYLSIGEVLEQVQAEFPDVSISKIRFLEAEGLIQPDRTTSGYRKFYDKDLARLRYILSLQRDHFLPLRVIRERLAEAESNGGVYAVPAAPSEPSGEEAAPAGVPPSDLSGAQLNREELRAAAGLTEGQLKELEDFGLLDAAGVYDENDLVVGRAARRFFDYGVEGRHLKMYRQFAEREAAFFEQIVMPVARRRDPAAQGEATRSLQELAGLARQIKEAALRSSLRDLL